VVNETDPSGPCDPMEVVSVDGARLICCAHGGHILGWVPAGAHADRLWLSTLRQCGPGLAIRGGIPVIFPQFADRGPLPKHGVARDRAWVVTASGVDSAGRGHWSARLRSDELTMRIWPHEFTLDIDARAGGSELQIALTVVNDSGDAFSFAAALHAYLRVSPATTVTGLGGLRAQDNARGGSAMTLAAGPIRATAARDIAVLGVDGPVEIADPNLGTVTIRASGFPDRVIWNPGPTNGIADIPAGADDGFACVEPALLEPIMLAPGASWTGTVSFQVGPEIP
jgi:glucose-6-phosphate 1-epimerase